MTDIRDKLRASMDRALANAAGRNPEDIEAIVSMFRARFETSLQTVREKNPAHADRLAQAFEETVANFRLDNSVAMLPPEAENGYRDGPGNDPGVGQQPPARSNRDRAEDRSRDRSHGRAGPFFLGGLFCGGLLAAVAYLAVFGLAAPGSGTATPATGEIISAEDLAKAEPVVAETIAFLQGLKVRLDGDLVDVTVKNPERFEKLATALPEQYNTLSAATRSQVRLVFRKSEGGYKVLATSNICPLVIQVEPTMIDPHRETDYATMCMHFGIWNADGAEF